MVFTAVVTTGAIAAAAGDGIHSDGERGVVARWRPLLITAPIAVMFTVAVAFGLFALHAGDKAAYDAWPRAETAANPSTPGDALSRLATDSRHEVRAAVALNPATPADALTLLASDPDTAIRDAVARNPATPAVALTLLASDPDTAIRAAVARNPATPAATLRALTGDPDAAVSVAARGG